MRDPVIINSLELIEEALEIISDRYGKIENPDNFMLTDDNLTLMDAISMRLQLIGEKFKKIDHYAPEFWPSQGMDPQPIIRFRDFISHHYENVEFEVILDVCKNHLPDLAKKIKAILAKI